MAHDLAFSIPHDDLNQVEWQAEIIFEITGAHQAHTTDKTFPCQKFFLTEAKFEQNIVILTNPHSLFAIFMRYVVFAYVSIEPRLIDRFT